MKGRREDGSTPGGAATLPGVEVRVHDSVDRLPADALALMRSAEAAGSVYEGPDWFTLFGAEVPPPAGGRDEFWTLHRHGQCRLVLPVRRSPRHPLRGTRVDALGNYYTGLYAPASAAAPDSTAPANPPAAPKTAPPTATLADDWTALLGALLRGRIDGRGAVSRLGLEPLPAPALPALRTALAGLRLAWREEVAFGNWHEPVEGSFADYWAARPGQLRSTAERAGRRFARAGGTLEIVTGGDAASLAAALEAYETVYRASWKPQEPHAGFIPGLVRLAARRGWLRLGLARLEGRPLAAHLWLVHAGRAEIYKLAYVEDAAPWSLGTLLGRHLMAHVIDHDRVRELDYLTGDDDYKKLWMGQRRERWRIDAVNPGTWAGWAMALRRRMSG